VLLGNGDGTFQAARSFNTGDGYPLSLAVGDFNGDGHLDIAFANEFANTRLPNPWTLIAFNPPEVHPAPASRDNDTGGVPWRASL
jgi:hypothetical protein